MEIGSWRLGLCALANLWQRSESLCCSYCWGLLVLECWAGCGLAGSQQEPQASRPDLQSANVMPDVEQLLHIRAQDEPR